MRRSGIARTVRNTVSRPTATPSRSASRAPARPATASPIAAIMAAAAGVRRLHGRVNPESCSAKVFVAQSRVSQKSGGPECRSGPDTRRLRYRQAGGDTENALDELRRRNAGTPLAHPAAESRCGWSRPPAGRREHRHCPNAGTSPSRRLQRTRKILNHRCQCRAATRPEASRKVRQIQDRMSLDIPDRPSLWWGSAGDYHSSDDGANGRRRRRDRGRC